jgi:cyclin H
VYEAALNYVRASRLTDAELIYTPSQIALAAFSLAAPVISIAWSKTKAPSESFALDSLLEDIRSLITSHGQNPNVDAVRDVDRRLKLCKNPEKVVGSKAYHMKKAEDEKKAEERRSKKAIEIQNAVGNGDPFGNELTKPRVGLVDYDDDDD